MKKAILVIMLLSISLLMAEDAEKLASVYISGDTLMAKIIIPKDMHMAKQEDFVYVVTDSIPGLKFGETIWPEGGHLDELGLLNYESEVILKRSFTVSDELKGKACTLKVFVGYQMCFATYCKPPEELEFELDFKAQDDKGCGGCMHPCGE